MKKYLWENSNWQDFECDNSKIMGLLSKARFLQGELIGKVSALDIKLQKETQSEILVEETIKTAKIEGLELDIDSVRSSVAERLGFPEGIGFKQDRNTQGLVDILIDAARNHNTVLSIDRLNGWHAALFPTGYSGFKKITTADLRKDKVVVVSGRIGKEKIHFEAPPAKAVKEELKIFINWFNKSLLKEDGLLRAAAAHLKFVTIHPYDDGNGRLTRVITDMAMAQDEKSGMRFYSLSSQIMKERKDYYQILKEVQNLKADLTKWYEWFLNMFMRALQNSQDILERAFIKANFWKKIKDIALNERQIKVVQKLLDIGIGKFEGGLTTRKYVSMTKISAATAFREIEDMRQKGILKPYGRGRSVYYEINI
ncbi:MAG: DUF4172 domain-containing protein [Endomicrobium sp.]|jgi:Fic family protein|nr:DUF4172 domain-containing protein [Endomicrobium sp.]